MSIGANWAEIWAPVWGPVWTQSAPTPTPSPAPPKATGRARRRQRFVVEIDGELFEAADERHAREILAQARMLAERAAQARADDIVERAAPKVIEARIVKRVAIKTPKVTVSRALERAADDTRAAIERAYRDASMRAELQLLLALASQVEAEQDEEDVLLLLH